MRMIRLTRRDLLKAGANAAGLTLLPRPLVAHFGGAGWEPVPAIRDPKVKELAMRAVAASRAAGADYADVRLTHTRERQFQEPHINERESLHVGVRALVQGYWGFASSATWTLDEMTRLAKAAVQQAKINSLGKSREVEFAAAPPIADGNWVMPVKADPFEVSPLEIMDVRDGMQLFANSLGFALVVNLSVFLRQDRAFASTDGSYCTQRLYRSAGAFGMRKSGNEPMVAVDFLRPAGVGWELYTDHQPLEERVRRLAAEWEEEMTLPLLDVEVGRYDTVADPLVTATLVDSTLGRATQLDRALGYEANGNGTSYLNNPTAMLGSYQVGAGALTVKGNRSESGGCATVQWDDEGVRPDEFTLVKEGVLTDFQTTREAAGWLREPYAAQGRPMHSHGCATAPMGLDAPLLHTPNLVMVPGGQAQDFDALVATLKQGIALKAGHLLSQPMVYMDFQCLNGIAAPRFYQVKAGRRTARITAAGILFRSPELWKGLVAVGGPASAQRFGLPAAEPYALMDVGSKGEPPQTTYHSVTAPPALFRQLTVIDLRRRS